MTSIASGEVDDGVVISHLEAANKGFEEDDFESAAEAAEELADMDCGICSRMGQMVGGVALAGSAAFDDMTAGALAQVGESATESLLAELGGD